MTMNNNQVPQMINKLRTSEQQNAQQLQNLANQVQQPGIRQQLTGLQNKEQMAAKQLGQMSSPLTNQSGMGMTQMSGLGSGLTARTGGANFGQKTFNSMGTGSGFNRSLGGSKMNTSLGMGVNNTGLGMGIGSTQSGPSGNVPGSNSAFSKQKQTTTFGMGNLIKR